MSSHFPRNDHLVEAGVASMRRAQGRLFWFDGSVNRLPGIEPALQGVSLREALISKHLRHTGAG